MVRDGYVWLTSGEGIRAEYPNTEFRTYMNLRINCDDVKQPDDLHHQTEPSLTES